MTNTDTTHPYSSVNEIYDKKISIDPKLTGNTYTKASNNNSIKPNSANAQNGNGCGATSNNSSSYKYLSWREKDRRRRFREEWRHMWLVVPHGNFEVQCLVCRKVMTQRKLDTIKRHTVRRHAEVLEMGTSERALLFEKLLVQHGGAKITCQKPGENERSNISSTNVANENEVIECRSATSSSSLSPLEALHPAMILNNNNNNNNNSNTNNIIDKSNTIHNHDCKYFPKRSKYSRKNVKNNNLKSNHQKLDATSQQQSSETTMATTTASVSANINNNNNNNNNNNCNNIRSTTGGVVNSSGCGSRKCLKTEGRDTKFSCFPTPTHLDRLVSNSKSKSLQDFGFQNFNGSCPSLVQTMSTALLKCPWCLEDFNTGSNNSERGSSGTTPFSYFFAHVQQSHPDKLMGPLLHESQNPLSLVPDIINMSHSNTHNQPFLTNNNHLGPNMMSLLYYQELFRRKTSQYSNPVIDPLLFNQSILSGQSCLQSSASTTSSPCQSKIQPLFAFSHSQTPIQTSNAVKHPLPLNALQSTVMMSLETSRQHSIKSDDNPTSTTSSQSGANSPQNQCTNAKRMNFSAEALFTDFTAQSAFYNPKQIKLDEKVTDNNRPNNNINLNSIKSEPVDPVDGDIISENVELCNTARETNLSPVSAAHSNMICHALRFGPGQDLIACLKEYVKRKCVTAAFVLSCCGSLKEAEIRMADSGVVNGELEVKHFCKHFEIVSLEGSIFSGGSHLHISLSDSEGKVIGGHVVGSLVIHTTAEILLGQMNGIQMTRQPDSNTGFSELGFAS